jgi:hypothetical protein
VGVGVLEIAVAMVVSAERRVRQRGLLGHDGRA